MSKVNLLNQKRLARFLGVHRETIRRWRQQELWGSCHGSLQPIQIGKRFYYSYEMVQAWINLNGVRSSSALRESPQAPAVLQPTS